MPEVRPAQVGFAVETMPPIATPVLPINAPFGTLSDVVPFKTKLDGAIVVHAGAPAQDMIAPPDPVVVLETFPVPPPPDIVTPTMDPCADPVDPPQRIPPVIVAPPIEQVDESSTPATFIPLILALIKEPPPTSIPYVTAFIRPFPTP